MLDLVLPRIRNSDFKCETLRKEETSSEPRYVPLSASGTWCFRFDFISSKVASRYHKKGSQGPNRDSCILLDHEQDPADVLKPCGQPAPASTNQQSEFTIVEPLSMGNTNSQSGRDGGDPATRQRRASSSSSSLAGNKLFGRRDSAQHIRGNPESSLSRHGQALFAQALAQGDTGGRSSDPKDGLSGHGAGPYASELNTSNRARVQSFAAMRAVDCSDCVDGDPPRWCVLGFGVFVCDECAGAFRSLPATVHGGVRSIYLDDWTDIMLETVTAKGGNDAVNEILEYHVPPTFPKPRKGISRGEDRRRWVNEKYRQLAFKRQTGKQPLKAVPAKLSASHLAGVPSFMAGKEAMVGVVDVTVLSVDHLPKFMFSSRRLLGGFVLSIKLGRFHGQTISSLSGRKWLGHRIHLSWDGRSFLEAAIRTGSGKVLGSVSRPLTELESPGSRSFVVDLCIETPSKRNLLEELKLNILDELKFSGNDGDQDEDNSSSMTTVSLRIDFVDLRS